VGKIGHSVVRIIINNPTDPPMVRNIEDEPFRLIGREVWMAREM